MDKPQANRVRTPSGAGEERSDQVPTSSIAISTEAMSHNGVAMMASDWIPNEPLPAGPQFSEDEYKRDLERMQKMLPAWALTKKSTAAEAKGKVPPPADNPLR